MFFIQLYFKNEITEKFENCLLLRQKWVVPHNTTYEPPFSLSQPPPSDYVVENPQELKDAKILFINGIFQVKCSSKVTFIF